MIDLENFPAEGPLFDALSSATAALGIRMQEVEARDFAYAYRREPELTTDSEVATSRLDAERSACVQMDTRSTRRHYGKYFRRLERQSGQALIFSDRGGDPHAIVEFLDLQAAGWKGDISKGGGAFKVTGWDSWFIETTDAFRADGQLAVYTLSTGHNTVCMQVAVRSGPGLFAIQDAYDESYSQFRPGNLGRLAVIEHSLAESDAAFFDPNMQPSYVDSTSLYPYRRRYARYVLSVNGLAASLMLRLHPIVRRTRARMRRGR